MCAIRTCQGCASPADSVVSAGRSATSSTAVRVHNRRTYVDLYCERLAPSLIGEPLNTLSNVAFFVAAWLVARDARRLGAMRADIAVLAALTVVVGIGSIVFHTLPTTWAKWLDLLP